jgi:hypothetical protein
MLLVATWQNPRKASLASNEMDTLVFTGNYICGFSI